MSMRRSFTYAALLTALAVAACSDTTPPTTPQLTRFNGSRGNLTTLEAYIQGQIDLVLPKGFEDAVDARWTTVQKKKNGGDMPGAVKQLNSLAAWILKKTNDITPPAGETKGQAAARLILNMSNWLYNGANAPVSLAGADVAVQVVPAGAAATVTTPSQQAAVSIVQGSTNEERILMVVQDIEAEAAFTQKCQGPLPTQTRCQYPRFYKMMSFPDNKLNISGRFAVCHRKTGIQAPTEAEHGRIRLAHNLPADPANYTAGAIKLPDEGIEILALAPTTTGIVNCDLQTVSAPSTGLIGLGQRALYAVANFAGKILTPKNAYAYDSGPEHFSVFFSNFNAVELTPVLIYGPSMNAPTATEPQNELTIAEAAGFSVTVKSASQWADMTAADFAGYRAIIFGDPSCAVSASPVAAANANKAVWSSAILGPVVINGTDPIEHQETQAQALVLVSNSIKYAASTIGKTGLYASLSCYYFTAESGTSVDFLSGIGDFRVMGQGSPAPNAVTIASPSHPVMAGLTSAGLSNWTNSVHEFFSNSLLESWPAGFEVLATAVRPASEGSSYPYIIARGAISPPIIE